MILSFLVCATAICNVQAQPKEKQKIQFLPTYYNLPSCFLGQARPIYPYNLAFTVKNVGTESVKLSKDNVKSSNGHLTFQLPKDSIYPGETVEIKFTYIATVSKLGQFKETLTFNVGDKPSVFTISGSALPL